ncbi:unnamed protein product [Symbiodinium sp. KB8]|nr:unnamed protein product [Symbiodinium sp. KB8]
MLTGNPMGIGGVAAALQGGLALAGVSNTVNPMALAADSKAARELYLGNLPAGITGQQLMQFLNQVAIFACSAVLDPSLKAQWRVRFQRSPAREQGTR